MHMRPRRPREEQFDYGVVLVSRPHLGPTSLRPRGDPVTATLTSQKLRRHVPVINLSFGAGKPDSVPRLAALRQSFLSTPSRASPRPGACPAWRCGIPAAMGRAAQPPILPCTGRGLSCRPPRGGRGGLLPHLFTLTRRLPAGRFVFCYTEPSPRFETRRLRLA